MPPTPWQYAQLRETYVPDNTGGAFGFHFHDPDGPSPVAGTNPTEALNDVGARGWQLASQWTQIVNGKSTTVYTFKRQ